MFEKEIKERLQQMHDSGMSYDEISAKTGITKSVVAYCISGSRPIKNPTISLLLKVFPHCRIDLEGSNRIATADHGGVAVNGNGNNFFAEEKNKIRKIADAVMASDMDAESKVKVYSIIKEYE